MEAGDRSPNSRQPPFLLHFKISTLYHDWPTEIYQGATGNLLSPFMPLRIIELAGDPMQRGRRHGELLALEIRRMRRALLSYLLKVTGLVGLAPVLGLLLFFSRRFWTFIPSSFREEIRGLAAGAHLEPTFLLLINVLDDLANNFPRCSALAVGPDLTETGAWLTGRNLDYPLFTDVLVELQTLFVIRPHQGLPLASLAWPGYIGVCTGLNRAGVSLTQLSAMSRECSLRGMPAALRFRQALEKADNVQEVAVRILQAPATIGNNVLLCGPQGALVLEISARHAAVRHPVNGLLTVTNHYQSVAMAAVKGRFPRRPPLSVLPSYYFSEAYSQARNTRLQQLARPPLTPATLKKILADPQIANPGSVVCTFCAPADLTLWVAQAPVPPVNRGHFEKISLARQHSFF